VLPACVCRHTWRPRSLGNPKRLPPRTSAGVCATCSGCTLPSGYVRPLCRRVSDGPIHTLMPCVRACVCVCLCVCVFVCVLRAHGCRVSAACGGSILGHGADACFCFRRRRTWWRRGCDTPHPVDTRGHRHPFLAHLDPGAGEQCRGSNGAPHNRSRGGAVCDHASVAGSPPCLPCASPAASRASCLRHDAVALVVEGALVSRWAARRGLAVDSAVHARTWRGKGMAG